MIFHAFSVYDSKAASFSPPFFVPAVGVATRSFSDVANDPTTDICKHPEDYTLYSLGTFDSNLATFDLGKPSALITASSCKQPKLEVIPNE